MPKLEKTTTISAISLARCFMRDAGGATSIEYAMIASGIAVVIATTIVGLGSSVKGLYSNVLTAIK